MSSPRPAASAPTGPILRLQDLRTYFYLPARGRFLKAVDGVSLDVQHGETLAIVGESGSGKSVTMLSLMGLVTAVPGIVDGRIWYRPAPDEKPEDLLAGLTRFARLKLGPPIDVHKDTLGWSKWHESGMKERRGRDFAMIFQNPRNALNPYMTIGHQILEAIRRRSPQLGAAEAAEEARRWLAKVRIDDPTRRMTDYPHNLSGGMCQRVMIAMALAARPVVLIADEPTTGLDATIQSHILDLMEEMKAELKTTTIVITHDMGVARRLADRIAVMYAGRVVEEGPAEAVLELRREPKHPYTTGLLSAIPTAEDILHRRRLTVIDGDVPDLSRLGTGCQFLERCALKPAGREHLCADEPPLGDAAEWQRVRCWRHLRHATEA